MKLPNLVAALLTAAALAVACSPGAEPTVADASPRHTLLYSVADNERVPDTLPEGEVPPPSGMGPGRSFWVAAGRRGEYREVTTTLVGHTDTFRVWAQDSTSVSPNLMLRAAREADTALQAGLLATLAERALMVRPDLFPIDLVYAELSAMGGYFSSADQPGDRQHPYSNNASAIYVSLSSCSTNGGCSAALIQHEVQHLLQYAVDPEEETWFNEGLSKLAEGAEAPAPLACTDFELFGWSSEPAVSGLHYRSAASFLTLVRDTLGPEALLEVAVDPQPGRQALSAYLTYHATGLTLDDLFLQWSVAQVAPTLISSDGDSAEPASCPNLCRHELRSGATISDTVSQYGCDVVLIPGDWEGQLEFGGAATADLVPEFPPNSSLVWWSGNDSIGNATLTAAIDLRHLEEPWLRYWVWHDIEEYYDWAYVGISSKQGATWEWLRAPGMTTKDPFGNSPGVGYTGASEEWRQEEVDLRQYAGREVLVRFGYLTDDAIEATGFAVNRVEVVEAKTGVVQPYLRWQRDGFRPLSLWAPQPQSIAALALDAADPSRYRSLPLEQGNSGSWALNGQSTAAVMICGLTAGALPTAYELRGIQP